MGPYTATTYHHQFLVHVALRRQTHAAFGLVVAKRLQDTYPGGCASLLVEQYTAHHGSKEETEAAGETLYPAEVATWRTVPYREPDVVVSQVPPGTYPEQMVETCQFSQAGNTDRTIHLKEDLIEYNQISHHQLMISQL